MISIVKMPHANATPPRPTRISMKRSLSLPASEARRYSPTVASSNGARNVPAPRIGIEVSLCGRSSMLHSTSAGQKSHLVANTSASANSIANPVTRYASLFHHLFSFRQKHRSCSICSLTTSVFLLQRLVHQLCHASTSSTSGVPSLLKATCCAP